MDQKLEKAAKSREFRVLSASHIHTPSAGMMAGAWFAKRSSSKRASLGVIRRTARCAARCDKHYGFFGLSRGLVLAGDLPGWQFFRLSARNI
jgi:hypothetical protein